MTKVSRLLTALLFISVCFMVSCGAEDEEEKAYISFANDSSYNVTYGIRFGDAVWDKPLPADSDTYDSWGEKGTGIKPGTYYVQMKGSDGTWTDASTTTFTVEADGVYDVTVEDSGSSVKFVLYKFYETSQNSVDKKVAPKDKIVICEVPANTDSIDAATDK